MSYVYEFQGCGSFMEKNDEDSIKHLDLVVIDQKGTSMYAEVSLDAIAVLKPVLKESKIFYMKKIIIEKAKAVFKPVRNRHMIKLTKWAELKELQDEPINFPKYTFSLTPFQELPRFERNNEYFIDVIGRIVALSDPVRVTTNTGITRTKRIIQLMDISGNKIDISLWGQRAEEFQGEQVYKIGQQNPIIAIFVGTSVKSYNSSTPFLSGTAACRWYINVAEIPEIATFYASIVNQPYEIQKINLQGVDELQNRIEEKTLLQLKYVDPFEDLKKRFECTITIKNISQGQPWCYPACPKCNTAVKCESGVYTCKKEETVCPHIIHKYGLVLTATDGTWELEFMLFDERATALIGTTAEKLLRQYSRFDRPPQIAALIGEKITVIVKVMPGKTASKPNKDPTFDILNIKKRHGKDLLACDFKKEHNQAIVGSSCSYSGDLPPLIPIEPKKQEQPMTSQPLSPHDIQLMEIDQTSHLDGFNTYHKRPYNTNNDSDKESCDDNEGGALLINKFKKKRE